MTQEDGETALGDDVYASFDGAYIKLRTQVIRGIDDVVYLEPGVVDALIEFVKDHAAKQKTSEQES